MANILLSDGEGLYPAEPEDAESPEIRAFMLLLENMDAVLNTVYLPGPIYSYVLPSQGDPDFMEGFEFSVRFDFDDYPQEQATWDKRNPEEAAEQIAQARGAIGAFLKDLEAQVKGILPYGPVEFTQGEGGHESLLVRTGDPRKLLYGLAMLAAQHGYQSKLYPVERDGRPVGEVTHRLVEAANGGTLHGRVYAFVNSAEDKGKKRNALPALPHKLEKLGKAFESIGIDAGTPPFFTPKEDGPVFN